MVTINLPIFSGENFSVWLFRINSILEEKEVKDALNENFDLTKEENRKKDIKARTIITQAVTDKYIEYIRDAKTARQMVKSLQAIFERKSTLSKLYIRKKLLTLKLDSKEKMEDHFRKLDTLLRELEDTGSKMEESDKVCHLLLTIPEKYETVITAIETITERVTLDFVKARLLDAELKYQENGKHISVNDTSFQAKQIENSKVICYKCKEKGHIQKFCPKNQFDSKGQVSNRGKFTNRGNYRGNRNNYFNHRYKREQVHMSENFDQSAFTFVALNTEIKETTTQFIIDSGATDHLVKENLQKYMTEIKKLETEVSIKIANGETIIANMKGKLKFEYNGKHINLEALIVPKLCHNLLSVRKLISSGKKVIFSSNGVKIIQNNVCINCESNNKLFFLTVNLNLNETSSLVAAEIWHKRLGHLNRHGLKLLGLPVSNKICETCMKGKSTRLPFKPVMFRKSKRVGELLHTDLCGPIKPSTINGESYFQTITDDFSHFTKVYLLKNKSEAEENIKRYVRQIEAEFGSKVCRIRCDNGREFVSNNLNEFCGEKGIILQFTMTYTPQQNGVSERLNRTLLNKARTMFIDSDLPKILWGESINCAAYQLNRCLTAALNGAVPAEIWYGRLNLDKLRIFGSKAWAYVLPKDNKLNERAIEVRMIGYCDNGYRLWNLKNNKIITCRDVRFDESSNKIEENNKANEKENRISIENRNIDEEYLNEENLIDNEEYEINKERRINKRITKIPEKYKDYELYSAYCLLTEVDDPKTFDEAIKNEEWKEAINNEIKSLIEMDTWEECSLPKNQKAIDTKWIFKTKNCGIKKARLVAKGFQETINTVLYAPVARLSTIRMLISLALHKDWLIRQMDIPSAFLNGILKNDVFIKPPKGLKVENGEVLKLKKSLYGLKESPRCWNDRFNEFAVKNNLRRSRNDFCLYYKENLIVVIFVDDILLTGNKNSVETIINLLKEEFKAKDMGALKEYLGIEIEREQTTLKIKQEKMIEKILKKFNMEECKGSKIPMEPNLDVTLSEELINVPYRELIGSLMYISLGSRPDITFAVTYLSQFLDKPTITTWKAAKKVVKYLKESKKIYLEYRKMKHEDDIYAYSDSDWGSDKINRKSISGCVIFYKGNPIHWHSRKQHSVALSSTESEYIAASITASELLSVIGVASNMEKLENKTRLIYVDNQGTIQLTKGYENSKRSKHIDTRYHFIKDLVEKSVIDVKYIPTDKNIADIFTKALNNLKFNRLRQNLNLC